MGKPTCRSGRGSGGVSASRFEEAVAQATCVGLAPVGRALTCFGLGLAAWLSLLRFLVAAALGEYEEEEDEEDVEDEAVALAAAAGWLVVLRSRAFTQLSTSASVFRESVFACSGGIN